MRHIFRASILTAVLLWPSAAELNSNDRAVIKEMTRGELYLRNNLPCRYTSGGFGVGAVVVTEVSPTGVDWDKNLQTIHEQQQAKGKKRWSGVDTVFWGFGPNDVIRYAKLYFKDNGVVELWAEGVKPKNVEVWVRFVGIQTREDFKKAFNLILSPKLIQEDHPDWAPEIRKAIADRSVVEGMTKAQAFAVVGTPMRAMTSEEGGKQVEVWFPRQETGASGSWGRVISASTGFPAELRFIDGKVAAIMQTASPVKVNIDK
jgi:hypothetical protein